MNLDNPTRPQEHLPSDPLPDPEPAAPSLDTPDPGVYHHEPAPTTKKPNP